MTDDPSAEDETDTGQLLRRRFLQIDARQEPLSGAEVRARTATEPPAVARLFPEEDFVMVDLTERQVGAAVDAEFGSEDAEFGSRRRGRWSVLILAAAALLLVILVAGRLLDDDAPSGVVAEGGDAGAAEFAGVPPILAPTADLTQGQDPFGLPGVESGTYRLEALDGTVVSIPADPDVVGGFHYLPVQLGDLARETFVPASDGADDLESRYGEFGRPSERHPIPTLYWFPLVELVSMPALGSTTQAVTETIVTTDGLAVVSEPATTSLGGMPATTFDVLTEARAVIAESPGSSGNPNFYHYEADSLIRFYVVDAPEGPVVAAISTDAAGFDNWVRVGERFLDGLVFTAAFG